MFPTSLIVFSSFQSAFAISIRKKRRNSPIMIGPWRFSSTTNNTTSYDLFIAVVKFISNKSPSVMLATIIFNFKFYMLWIANIILFFLTQGKSRFRKYPWYPKRQQNQTVLWKFHTSPPSNIPHIIMADRNGRLLIELLAVKVRHCVMKPRVWHLVSKEAKILKNQLGGGLFWALWNFANVRWQLYQPGHYGCKLIWAAWDDWERGKIICNQYWLILGLNEWKLIYNENFIIHPYQHIQILQDCILFRHHTFHLCLA